MIYVVMTFEKQTILLQTRQLINPGLKVVHALSRKRDHQVAILVNSYINLFISLATNNFAHLLKIYT